jgi:acyl-CoA hydrolase
MPNSTTLIELVFPQQTNHHGTLYGGTALALMDKAGFLTASRYARRSFVTAASQQIDFIAPARKGQIIELTGSITKLGRTAVTTTVTLTAEDLLSGERHLCTRGNFVFVAVDSKESLAMAAQPATELPPHAVHMVEMIFPGSTNHHGTLYGGTALELMGKAAFVAATRFCRQVMMMTVAQRTDFHAPAHEGELVDLVAVPVAVQGSDLTVEVTMLAENLLTGVQRLCTRGQFIMQARDESGQTLTIAQMIERKMGL